MVYISSRPPINEVEFLAMALKWMVKLATVLVHVLGYGYLMQYHNHYQGCAVLLCGCFFMLLIFRCETFTHTIKNYFTGTGASSSDEVALNMGKIGKLYQTTQIQ